MTFGVVKIVQPSDSVELVSPHGSGTVYARGGYLYERLELAIEIETLMHGWDVTEPAAVSRERLALIAAAIGKVG